MPKDNRHLRGLTYTPTENKGVYKMSLVIVALVAILLFLCIKECNSDPEIAVQSTGTSHL